MSRKSRGCGAEKSLTVDEQQAKINEVRKMIGPIAEKCPIISSDDSISRYLRARNWHTKKACKMLIDSVKWRLEYKPEKILWEDVSREAETGRIYRANFCDKLGRPVLVMRPGFQNTSSTEEQIKYLIYCMENAVMNLNPDRESMVWLIDFQGWTMGSVSVKVTRETANVLQNHYPERLGLAILYNPPKVFESFWTVVKPFLEPKTYKKVRFAYPNDPQSQKIMEALFDINKLDSAFGGRNTVGFEYEAFRERMRADDKKKSDSTTCGCSLPPDHQLFTSQSSQSESTSDQCSEGSDNEVDEVPLRMESIDEKVPGQRLSYEDVPKSEAATAKQVQ